MGLFAQLRHQETHHESNGDKTIKPNSVQSKLIVHSIHIMPTLLILKKERIMFFTFAEGITPDTFSHNDKTKMN